MRAFVLDSFDVPPRLRHDVAEPRPSRGELIVRVQASSINPVDATIAAGGLKQYAEHEFPVTLGRDFAGVVEQAGEGTSRFAAGDEVFGFVRHAAPAVHNGSWTELLAIPEDTACAKPASVDMRAAGAAPLAAITALVAFDALALREGETVLVVGATGGVGSFFVQFAADAGAHVVAPALAEDEEYLRGLGATEIVDRGADPGAVDAIFDLVSYAPHPWPLNEGGRIASPLGAAGEGPGRFNVMAEPAPANVARVGSLLEAGTLRVPIRREYRLEEAGEALEELKTSHTQGKLALAV